MFNTLGKIYDNGSGLEKDYKKAYAYYEKAKQEGSVASVSTML